MSDLHLWHSTELGKLRRDMEELFESFVRDFCSPVDLRLLRCDPAVRIVSEGDTIIVTAQIPNLDPKSLKVTVSGNVLSITGEKVEEEKAEQHFSISRQGFSSAVRLPCQVDEQQVRAHYAKGELRVFLPKKTARSAVRLNMDRFKHERGEDE